MKLDLEVIRERCDKATPGPWKVAPRNVCFFQESTDYKELKEQTNALYLAEEN